MTQLGPTTMALSPGVRLGPYEILAAIGAGGMGEVYRARDTRLDRTVAIKTLPPELAADSEFRQRFNGEARAISQLSHPNICTLHDVGEHDATTYLVMEYVVGETLADRLARGGAGKPAVSQEDALHVAIQIADALATAHRHGIIHRDLKPGNVMLAKLGGGQTALHAKLMDFGLAKPKYSMVATASVSLTPTSPAQAVTAQGVILGTIQYMAPEQIEGGDVDERSDIFAFGSVLFEMLAGRRAFEGKTHANVMAAILEREPPFLGSLLPRTPPLVDAIVKKCLAKSPDDRWQSAADLATALRWVANQGDIVVMQMNTRDKPPATFLTSRFNEIHARFSPNGRWVAYASDESGAFQVYVRPFPKAPGQWSISANGGTQPEWRGDGKELFFISGDGKLMAVDVTTDSPAFTASVPRALFDVNVPEVNAPYPGDFAASADGQRFLINTIVDQPTKPVLTVILNWAAELSRR